ncbi:MAG: TIGR03086 family protein [Actinobacteria bacterium 13_2_20CM_2_71_6]|nr:MAG: TIGR03086 family protein [Actinobacteria bacterium 13_2_20CM_2_71_6]
MTDRRATAALIGGIALLERAVNYTLGSLHLVTPEALGYPTPCRDWDLRALLRHLDDSFLALHEAIDIGHVDLDVPGGDPAGDPVAGLRNRACQLLGAWTAAGRDTVSIAGRPLTTALMTSTGAIEVAIHGWDVARACGGGHPIPASLAEEMLELSPLFVTGADRPIRFAVPVAVSPLAGPADRLVAFLGRHPDWAAER